MIIQPNFSREPRRMWICEVFWQCGFWASALLSCAGWFATKLQLWADCLHLCVCV